MIGWLPCGFPSGKCRREFQEVFLMRSVRKRILPAACVFACLLTACSPPARMETDLPAGLATVLSDTAVGVSENGSFVFYALDRESKTLTRGHSLKGNYTVSDVSGGRVLLQSGASLLLTTLNGSDATDLASLFPEEEREAGGTCRVSFADGGQALAAAKALHDPQKPIEVAGNVLGYSLDPASGLYVYDLSGSLIHSILLADFGAEYTGTDTLFMETTVLPDHRLAVVLGVQPLGSAFATRYFYTVNIYTGDVVPCGHLPLGEAQDATFAAGFIGTRYVTISPERLTWTDFDTAAIYRRSIAATDATAIALWAEEGGGSFAVEITAQEGKMICRYTFAGESLDSQELSEDAFQKSAWLSCDGTQIRPSAAQAKKWELPPGQTVWRGYADGVWLTTRDSAALLFR